MRQHIFMQQGLRSNIFSTLNKPPNSSENRHATRNQTSVVHINRRNRQRIRETVDDHEHDDVEAGHDVNGVADLVAHLVGPGSHAVDEGAWGFGGAGETLGEDEG